MDKHTKTMIIFFVSMLIASIVTFSILYLLPLCTSGNSPPEYFWLPTEKSHNREVNHSCGSLILTTIGLMQTREYSLHFPHENVLIMHLPILLQNIQTYNPRLFHSMPK